jgi:RNA polymerase sigma-70 factor (ECF subfamily)
LEETTTHLAPALSDSELATLLRENPTNGIGLLYDRYGRLVFSVALRIVQDHGAAEEITQDVFMRCWRTIDHYRPEQSGMATWLLTIARNRSVDELRSRRGKEARRELSDELIDSLRFDPGIDEILVRDDIRQALSHLPNAQREVIELVFWGGLTRREAAEQLDVPLGTVHTRLRLALDKLRDSLGHWMRGE